MACGSIYGVYIGVAGVRVGILIKGTRAGGYRGSGGG